MILYYADDWTSNLIQKVSMMRCIKINDNVMNKSAKIITLLNTQI